jgi:hypothetical protein
VRGAWIRLTRSGTPSDIARARVHPDDEGIPIELNPTTVYDFVSGDYIELTVHQNSTDVLDVLAGASLAVLCF